LKEEKTEALPEGLAPEVKRAALALLSLNNKKDESFDELLASGM